MQKVNVKLYNITDWYRLTNFCPKRYNMRSMVKRTKLNMELANLV